jgi:5-methylcytosine-specific restriction endonuclease McrA
MSRFYDRSPWVTLSRMMGRQAGHRCQVCGAHVEGRQANVHHVYPVADHIPVRFEPLNLRYLCVSCHRNEERNPLRGCDEQGFPRDRDHPCYAMRPAHTGGRVENVSAGEPRPRGAPNL